MSDTQELGMNDRNDSLATELGSLVPREAELNRDRLMYEAGRAAAMKGLVANRNAKRRWRLATGLSAATAVMLAMQLIFSPSFSPDAVTSIPIAKTPVAIQKTPIPSVKLKAELLQPSELQGDLFRLTEMSYLNRRNLVLAHGIERLPISESSGDEKSAPSVPYRELLNSLDELTGVGS